MIVRQLKEAGVVIDSIEMGESRTSGAGTSVHMVLYLKKTAGRTEVYDILMKSEKVISVDFL